MLRIFGAYTVYGENEIRKFTTVDAKEGNKRRRFDLSILYHKHLNASKLTYSLRRANIALTTSTTFSSALDPSTRRL